MATKKPTARIPQELKMANAIPVHTQPVVEPVVEPVVAPVAAVVAPVAPVAPKGELGAHGQRIINH